MGIYDEGSMKYLGIEARDMWVIFKGDLEGYSGGALKEDPMSIVSGELGCKLGYELRGSVRLGKARLFEVWG